MKKVQDFNSLPLEIAIFAVKIEKYVKKTSEYHP